MKHHEQYVNDKPHHVNGMQHLYENALGQQVLQQLHDPTQLGERTTGPYVIEQAHINDMLTNELHPDLTECISIRKVIPGH